MTFRFHILKSPFCAIAFNGLRLPSNVYLINLRSPQ